MSLYNVLFVSVASLLFIQVLTPLAVNIGLVDKPKGRKSHSGDIPLVGGLAIFCSLLLFNTIFDVAFPNINLFILTTSLVVFVGVLDDFFDLSVVFRLLVQFFVAFLFVFVGDYQIDYLGHFWGQDIFLGSLSIPFTLLSVVAAINMFNMIDGIDGLLGTMAIKAFGIICLLFYYNDHVELSVLPLSMCCALLPFLLLNIFGNTQRRRKKIFMGDGGSMFMGFTVVWLLVLATQPKYGVKVASPVVALWLIAIPLMDMVALMIRRLLKKQSPFKADREHLHHIFLRMGLTPVGALITISLTSLTFGLLGVLGNFILNDGILLSVFLLVFIIYYFVIKHIWRILTFVRKLKT